MSTKAVLSQALEALEAGRPYVLERAGKLQDKAIASLRAALADGERETETNASKLVKTAPPVVYLQVSDDRAHYQEPFPHGEEITWCADSVMDCEVRYLRADLIPPSPAALRAAVIAWQNTGDPSWIKVGGPAPDNENWLPLVRPFAADTALAATIEQCAQAVKDRATSDEIFVTNAVEAIRALTPQNVLGGGHG